MIKFMHRTLAIFAGLVLPMALGLGSAKANPITPTQVPGVTYAQLASYMTLPTLAAPTGLHDSVWAYHARIGWNAVAGGTIYELRINGAGGSGTGTTHFDRVLSQRSATVNLGPGRYIANVRAGRSASDVHGHWSSTLYFRVPRPQPVCSMACRALAWEFTQAGKWYLWGGSGPSTYDCSGLMMAAYLHADGIYLPHNTVAMINSGKLVRTYSPQPGDLAFYGTGHVEAYVRPGVTFGAHRSGTRIGYSYYAGSSWRPTMFFRVI